MAAGVRSFVFRVDLEALPPEYDGLEVLVTLYPNVDDEQAPPEVALRPQLDAIALRVWGPPLELVGQS